MRTHSLAPQRLQYRASSSWFPAPQAGHACVFWAARVAALNSTVTMPVGTAMIAYPKSISTEATHLPGTVCGTMSPNPTVLIVTTAQ